MERVEEQSLTVQRKAEEDQMILYTLLRRPLPFCHPVLHSCIRSITKTHKRGHTHTHTNTLRRVTSEWANEATEKRVWEERQERLVGYLSV